MNNEKANKTADSAITPARSTPYDSMKDFYNHDNAIHKPR
jgi:hypothetical protein